MKVVGFVGSPRVNGNTETLVNQILDGSSEEGAETKIFKLNKLDIGGCQACNNCKSSEGICLIKDDMQELYEEIKTADSIVLGSPVYMWQMSSQSKIFTDRLYAFFETGFIEKYGKKNIVLAFSQGGPDKKLFENYFDYLENMFTFLGFNVKNVFVDGGNNDRGSIQNKPNVMKKAKEIGKALVY